MASTLGKTQLVVTGLMAVLLGAPSNGAAQPQAEAPSAVQTSSAVVAGWDEGFFLQSADGSFRLVIGLVAQADARYVDDDSPGAAMDTFVIRKMRPMLSGRMARYFEFQVVPDLGSGTVILLDAYLDVRFSNAFRVRMGKSKTPIGYEVLIGDPFLLFPERTLVSSLIPNRDTGIQLLGDIAGGKLHYAAGVYNGIPDGTNSTADFDTNSGKDLTGRIVLRPFQSSQPGVWNGLGFAIGGSAGPQAPPLPVFRTSVGRRYFSYDAAAAAAGERTRIQPSIFYYYEGLGVFGEFARSAQEVTTGGRKIDVANQAWGVTASVVVTGEATSERGVRPRNGFDPAQGHWGALQLLARYSAIDFDEGAFAAGAAAVASARQARQLSVGFNWYPSYFIKYNATFERTTFGDASAAGTDEHALIVRAQVAF